MKKLIPQQSLDDLTNEYMTMVTILVRSGVYNDTTKAATRRFKDAAFRHGKQMQAFGYLEAKAEQLNAKKIRLKGNFPLSLYCLQRPPNW
jgi:hypothetical protein